MKVYIKLISALLALVFMLSAVSLLDASAEDFTYIQPEKFIYGDIDLDGNVTVKDATLIRKGLAKITYVTSVQRYLADPLGTGYSVKNATAIQKYLAKYETNTPWGIELEISSQGEFSAEISLDDMYHGNFISVRPISRLEFLYEYTLDDFPEYKFSKIEKFGSKEWGFITYLLYLEEPGKENLIEAVKALDYRASLDLQDAHPDDYAVSA